jgi:hypothetical protein
MKIACSLDVHIGLKIQLASATWQGNRKRLNNAIGSSYLTIIIISFEDTITLNVTDLTVVKKINHTQYFFLVIPLNDLLENLF